MCFAAFSNAVAEGKTLKRQHSGGLPSNEAENDTEESEGTSEIDQENEPGDDRSRGENDGKLGCCRTKLKEVVGGHFAVALGFGLLGSLSEFLTALASLRLAVLASDSSIPSVDLALDSCFSLRGQITQ